MKKPMNRRLFLRGAGGAAMAIPFLPSLMSRAFAAEPKPGAAPRCFMAMSTSMGEVWGKNMYPDQALLTQKMSYAGRDVRYGNLPATADNTGNVAWSPMCTAGKDLMTPALAAKFNVVRGLDVPYNFGHHEGVHLGNFAGHHGGTAGIPDDQYLVPTIDQVMAYSPSFYTPEDLSAKMTQRSFGLDTSYMSWNYANPTEKTGRVVMLPTLTNNQRFYDFFFRPGSSVGDVDKVIIDRVKESYDLLKKDPRLSYGDLDRLEQHVQRMFEIERQLLVAKALNSQQNLIQMPSKDSDDYFKDPQFGWTLNQMKGYCDLMTDMIVAAFSTGVSRIGTWGQQSCKFTDGVHISDWHGNVSHSGFGASVAQEWAIIWNQGTFEHAFVNLAAKLEAVTAADGGTLLDNCLLMLTNEAGQLTHQGTCVNYPVVMAGSAGGYFKTGMFVDFSDQTKIYGQFAKMVAEKPGILPEGPGLYYQQFLANALLSMGIPASEWEHFTEFSSLAPKLSTPTKGYGFHYVNPGLAQDYALAKAVMGDKLPVITS
jgi:hypothetical protein